MRSLIENPWRAAGLGAVLALVSLGYAAITSLDGHSAGVLAVRALHLIASMIWVGLIVFVNFVQLKALQAATDETRPALVGLIAVPVARTFTGAAHATLATGVIMIAPVMGSVPGRPLLLAGVVGGIAMWAIVQFILRPNVARIAGKVAATANEKAVARTAIALWARVNLILAIPVTVAMLVAAHAGL